MKTKTIIAVCILGALVACSPSGKSDSNIGKSNSTDLTVKHLSVTDSLVNGEHKKLAVYNIDYPESGNENFLNNVYEWINERMGGKYTGALTDPDKMMNFYVKENITSEDPDFDWNSEVNITLSKVYETDKFVTFCNTTYYYDGGAHGMSFIGGNTFRKSDGRKFGWDMFVSEFNYEELFKEALMEQYFKVKTQEELESNLQLDVPGSLPKPITEPYFTKDGVVFTYQRYEIACYAAGAPTFTIPYSKIEKYLTATAQKLLMANEK